MVYVHSNLSMDSHPHFWALALYRSKEYEKVGVPMMPNVKGKARTLTEMKIYSILLILLSLIAFLNYTPTDKWIRFDEWASTNYLISVNTTILSIWYATTVWKIDVHEKIIFLMKEGECQLPQDLFTYLFGILH